MTKQTPICPRQLCLCCNTRLQYDPGPKSHVTKPTCPNHDQTLSFAGSALTPTAQQGLTPDHAKTTALWCKDHCPLPSGAKTTAHCPLAQPPSLGSCSTRAITKACIHVHPALATHAHESSHIYLHPALATHAMCMHPNHTPSSLSAKKVRQNQLCVCMKRPSQPTEGPSLSARKVRSPEQLAT